MEMSELKITRWTLSHFEEACALWRGRVAELEAAERKPPEPTETQASEPDELQELHDQIDQLRGKHIHLISTDNTLRLDIGNVKKRLDRLEAWADKLADWSDQHCHYKFNLCRPKTKAPRLADDAR